MEVLKYEFSDIFYSLSLFLHHFFIFNMLTKKNSKTINRIIYWSQNTQYLSCFLYTIMFCCTKKKKKKMFIMFVLCFIKKNLLKREFQRIEFNHSSDIDFEDFMNLYKKCTAKPHSFLVIDTTLVSVCVCVFVGVHVCVNIHPS